MTLSHLLPGRPGGSRPAGRWPAADGIMSYVYNWVSVIIALYKLTKKCPETHGGKMGVIERTQNNVLRCWDIVGDEIVMCFLFGPSLPCNNPVFCRSLTSCTKMIRWSYAAHELKEWGGGTWYLYGIFNISQNL